MIKHLLLLLPLTLLPCISMAGSGSAIIPHWSTHNHGTHISISNITSNPIHVEVVFYGMNGEKIAPTSTSIEGHIINAKSTRHVTVKKGANLNQHNQGYGVVYWKNINEDDDSVALVAHGHRVTTNGNHHGQHTIVVNQGLPF
ncbi:hypothetical protein [Vibrio nigripulchritudo]|uniref:hypothetical protein n=1 Tax=Vibrio nigripulchritudo TaxID=28173 RepID=UPI0005FA1C2A|nr:hypothetical protein [Vibrio nigripulchritudo]KJY78937.1 hypothetical protein TW74_09530 [Vibrio nigripulchritudo]